MTELLMAAHAKRILRQAYRISLQGQRVSEARNWQKQAAALSELHGVITQKTVVLTITVMRTSNRT